MEGLIILIRSDKYGWWIYPSVCLRLSDGYDAEMRAGLEGAHLIEMTREQ
ncbi:MAG: hypothetical protein OXI43_03745 [Candidatus Poribacteria bacterium]|nr:hypothetical protein [Candidatus Poribacteria bacterium]